PRSARLRPIDQSAKLTGLLIRCAKLPLGYFAHLTMIDQPSTLAVIVHRRAIVIGAHNSPTYFCAPMPNSKEGNGQKVVALLRGYGLVSLLDWRYCGFRIL